MAVTAIDLNLEGDDLVFYSGQRVKGALVVQISLPVIIAGKVIVRNGLYRNDPKFSDGNVLANRADPDKTALIRVYTVCNSVCTFGRVAIV